MYKAMKKHLGVYALVILMVLMVGGCSGSVTTANFQDLAMASEVDIETMEPMVEKDVFAVEDPVIYVTGRLENAPEGTIAKSKWIYVDLEPEYVIDEVELEAEEMSSAIVFSLSRPDNGWPAGNYKVELYIDDELQETLTFTVE